MRLGGTLLESHAIDPNRKMSGGQSPQGKMDQGRTTADYNGTQKYSKNSAPIVSEFLGLCVDSADFEGMKNGNMRNFLRRFRKNMHDGLFFFRALVMINGMPDPGVSD